ncbi:LysR family transcriptional regulator [Alginatibacterium sediminis]|uniref:LysR family transcriptional regulator n=1 Tax=Alginatibacterium sediminis TaxID=2164068 RepID=A0A420E6F7_9ALTE|nr:LysR family transcriptional regulator [Alginatibacterium sediminis]RKF13650.1 LysR family transcriptional regulator [Alginatibacterium sediminis]
MKDLHDLDLNLLKLLQAVVETRNTHAAAEKLGISQTSVSRGLTKLRETFDDQLFIRKAHGLEPSELAEKLAEAVAEMLDPLAKVVESYQNFRPERFEGQITIALNVFFLDQYGDGIFSVLRERLPKADFRIIHWQENSLSEMLNGKIDYMVHFEAYTLPQEIYQHKLTDLKLYLVARENHPVLSQTSDWEAIHKLPLTRIIVSGVNSKRSIVGDLYASKGYEAKISLATHSTRVLINKLKHSDAIFFGSKFIANMSEGISSYPLPPGPKDKRQVQVNGGYLQSKRGNPLNQLIHQALQNYFDSVE